MNVAATPSGTGRLQVSISLDAAPGSPNNRIQALRFGGASNALVDIGAQTGLTGDTTVALPAAGAQTTFAVRRVTAEQAATVMLTVIDSCGDWSTLVGSGPGAF